MTSIAMFPLGAVLFPGMPLQLQVFEPRYRVLTARCLDGSEPFGVVLIERGSEVGGGDVRTDVGTLAHIVEATSFPDGRIGLRCVGGDRIRVVGWHADDPHPLADVEAWPDDIPGDVDAFAELIAETAALLVEALGRHALLGDRVSPDVAVPRALAAHPDEDPLTRASLASSALSALAPLGPLDQQKLLAEPDAGNRLATLTELLREDLDDLARRSHLG